MKNTKNLCKHALQHGGKISPLVIDSKASKHMGLTNLSILKYKDKWLVNGL